MKRLKVLWLFAVLLIVSCHKSDITVPPADQPEIAKKTGVHTYSVTISPVNAVNTVCSDLLLNVSTDKTSKGTIVLYEYEDIYHRVAALPRFHDMTIYLEEKVDPRIIGGFMLTAGDYKFDASVRHDLQHIKQEFINNLYRMKI